MSDDLNLPADFSADEMGEYVRIYVDETNEQADGLVEMLLGLERDPHDPRRLAEAFRLVHSVKGSAALLGLDRITTLAHHLETHFERLRSGAAVLDPATTNVALRFVDYLRAGNEQLRRGEPLPSNEELLAAVEALGSEARSSAVKGRDEDRPAPPTPVAAPSAPEPAAVDAKPQPAKPTALGEPVPAVVVGAVRPQRVTIHFRRGMPLAELKGELVLARLTRLGAVVRSDPPAGRLATIAESGRLDVWVDAAADQAALRDAADVDGAEGIEFGEPVEIAVEPGPKEPAAAAGGESRPDAQETVRVEVGRLDVLMNLAGELVVNRSRFVQVARQIAPTFRGAAASNRSTAIVEDMRHALEACRDEIAAGASASGQLATLEKQLTALEEQSRQWQEGRRHFDHMLEAIDQLTRVSDNLQRGVLKTRMVAVAPLFNRFKRSVRDIARELGKRVDLEIRGEKTELDKRMIDEIGDPLVHLVRNAIDHGIESADERRRRGKPETATLRLEAFHRGNSVCIAIADDGGGIDTGRIRQRAIERGLVAAEAAAGMSADELVDFIWQPGFSTAKAVSDISGRGVGMDIVRTKINRLNGSIDIATVKGEGTTFTIRLPLTLAIVRCMLFGLPHGVFAVPMENIRGIVAIGDSQIVAVNGRQACDIRGEFLPLVDIHDVFRWAEGEARLPLSGDVAVLHAAGRSIALRVGAPLGSQDIVVKSLDDNFRHVRGLGGASILGDGSVCLLLDVATAIDLAGGRRARPITPQH